MVARLGAHVDFDRVVDDAGDLWGSRVVITTSRGLGDTLAMAEYAVAGILHFAKGLHRAAAEVAVRRRDLRELCVD
jgi:phosphoglycerate dehydrogenase-like enzyme